MPQQTGRATGAKKGANTRKVQVPRGGLQPGSKYEKFAGTTPSLVPARAAATDRSRTSKVVQPGGILKDPTTSVKTSEQKQQDPCEEDPSALNESESRVSVSCVAAASQALSVFPPSSLMACVTDSIYSQPPTHRHSLYPCSAVWPSSRARRAWFARPPEREGLVAGTSDIDALALAFVFGWRLAAEDLQQKKVLLFIRCTAPKAAPTGTR